MARRKPKAQTQSTLAPALSTLTQQTIQAQFQGPLPLPAHLEKYDQIVPGAAERIISAWEKQTAHRHELEQLGVRAAVASQKRGAWLGFTIALIFLGVATALVLTGDTLAGTVFGSVDIVGLVSVFVYGKFEQRREREQKFEIVQRASRRR